MSRALIVLNQAADKAKATAWIAAAPVGTRVEFKKPVRSLDQNSLLWKMLTEIAEQTEWHGLRLTPPDWKRIMTAALRRELRLVPNLDGDGFVQLGDSTSDMTKEELSDLIELMHSRADQLGVRFSDPPAGKGEGQAQQAPSVAA